MSTVSKCFSVTFPSLFPLEHVVLEICRLCCGLQTNSYPEASVCPGGCKPHRGKKTPPAPEILPSQTGGGTMVASLPSSITFFFYLSLLLLFSSVMLSPLFLVFLSLSHLLLSSLNFYFSYTHHPISVPTACPPPPSYTHIVKQQRLNGRYSIFL